MEHARKVAAYKRLMVAKGIGAATASPPLWQLLWTWGVPLPPPLYMRFLPLALFGGTIFGLIFGAIAWAMGNRGIREMSMDEAALVALVSGMAFGLSVAWLTRRLARRHGLGSWAAFDGTGEDA